MDRDVPEIEKRGRAGRSALFAVDLLRAILVFIGRVRWQVLISLLGFAIFSVPAQIHEIYRIYTEVPSISVHVYIFVIGLVLLAFTLRNNLLLGLEQAGAAEISLLYRLLAALVAIAPLLGAAIGVRAALPWSTTDQDPMFRLNMLQTVLLIGSALLALLFLPLKPGMSPAAQQRRQWIRLLVAAAALLLSLPIFLALTGIVSSYGTLLIAIAFLLLLSCMLSYLTSLSLLWRLPLVGMLLFLSLIFSAFDLNNNHDIRLLHASGRPWDAKDAFLAWLDSRADSADYQKAGQKYPVFIVTAEGGGIYAANHTAQFLARMQDICPNFSQHVFMISAVSGGSLGAGIFAGIAKEHVQNAARQRCLATWEKPGAIEALARKALDHDFLAPLAGAAAFPDFLQYFLPFPVSAFDRAKTAEASFQAMWDAVSERDNPMAEDFLSLWTPEGAAPALLLNVTRVETGGRSEISHIELGDGFYRNGSMMNQESGDLLYSVRLSTAIGLSARFPWVTPAGRLNPEFPSNIVYGGTDNFVDGGYYDNSGADAALDLIERIREIPEFHSVDLRVIILKSAAYSETWAHGFDILMPLRTTLNSRVARARDAESRLLRALCPAPLNCDLVKPEDQQYWFSYLDGDSYELPLGWLFSQRSVEEVSKIIGKPQDCRPDDGENGCLIMRVRDLLQPKVPPG